MVRCDFNMFNFYMRSKCLKSWTYWLHSEVEKWSWNESRLTVMIGALVTNYEVVMTTHRPLLVIIENISPITWLPETLRKRHLLKKLPCNINFRSRNVHHLFCFCRKNVALLYVYVISCLFYDKWIIASLIIFQ